MIRNLEKYLFIINLFLNFLYTNSQNNIYSSITSLQDVLKTEKIMFHNLQKFVKESEFKIISMKKFLNNHKSTFESTNLLNSSIVFENPLGKIIILSKFLKLSGLIELLLLKAPETDLNNFKRFQFEHSYPTDEDLEDIVKGIVRLQKVYDLRASEFIQNYKINISSSDLLEIGGEMLNLNEDKFASEWLTASLKKSNLEKHESNDLINKINILTHLSVAIWREGGLNNSINAINILKQTLELNVDNESIEDLIEMFNSPFERDEVDKKIEEQTKLFNKACRGELKKSSKEISQLHCKYLTKNHPFLILARVKYEEFHKNPYVILFHNIISDYEIEYLQRAVQGNLKRATVEDVSTTNGQKTDHRTSSFAWLNKFDDKLVGILQRRIEDITNLVDNSESYEQLQIGNYGIGGHYNGHYDFFLTNGAVLNGVKNYAGNRIATLMFYLSDVRKGGATVFPYMNLTMWPQKGSAIFWYNLHANGEPDERTMHSGCPVIEGSKWVANQWIRVKEQIFRRPCELINNSKS